MDIEASEHHSSIKKESWRTVLTLAYQSLGVVYGDLSTSPLYVYRSTFSEDIHHSGTNEEIYGVLSFIFWTITLIPLIKYVFIVLRADDNGEGGTFALYSLLCRHTRISMLPNGQIADQDLSEYKKDELISPVDQGSRGKLRSILEKHKVLQNILLILSLIGACMVIGDGVLTPALSVFSAVSGLELSMSKEQHQYVEVPLTCIIIIFLFFLQHYGTHRLGFLFAPVVVTWLLCISAIGTYNIFYWNRQIFHALSPYYMYVFLKKTRTDGWKSLGGILLCITGSEAMFADLGHFSKSSIKIAFTFMVYPSLVLAYMGQAAYLSKNHSLETDYRIGFYESVPVKIRWPVLVIAVLAAVVGSQAVITGTFSIIKQCSALYCFPRIKIIHTSSRKFGQIYIPEINWLLMFLCLAITIGFRDTNRISNASGLAVITGMLVTTCLMSLVIVLCWKKNIFFTICFILFFGSIEALFFSASLVKFREGAWLPIVLALILILIMYSWHYGTLQKYNFDVQNKMSINWLLNVGPHLGFTRVPGIGLVHSELVSGIPPVFSHFLTTLPAFHRVLVFLCIKSVPVPHVSPDERFLVGRIGPKQHSIFRCVARYGYRDTQNIDDTEFEKDLVCSIAELIRSERVSNESDTFEEEKMTVVGSASTNIETVKICEEEIVSESARVKKRVRFVVPESKREIEANVAEEMNELIEAKEAGMTFIVGNCYVRAKSSSNFIRKGILNVGYQFLRNNSRGPAYDLSFTKASTLEVTMMYNL